MIQLKDKKLNKLDSLKLLCIKLQLYMKLVPNSHSTCGIHAEKHNWEQVHMEN